MSQAIEPPADPNYLVRDYPHELHVDEVWHDWNSYTRVGSIDFFEDGTQCFAP